VALPPPAVPAPVAPGGLSRAFPSGGSLPSLPSSDASPSGALPAKSSPEERAGLTAAPSVLQLVPEGAEGPGGILPGPAVAPAAAADISGLFPGLPTGEEEEGAGEPLVV
jgi:hypothetical protein